MLCALLVSLVMLQHPADHATMVMGFDQDKTAHHFRLFPDGGSIEVNTTDPNDRKDLDAIRAHMPHIAAMFGGGDFEAPMLVHDTKDVPDVDVLSARHDRLTYRYADTPAGGGVDIFTTDAEALAALHAFLRYQIREHETGDPGTVVPRR
jgi:hypothetical protein